MSLRKWVFHCLITWMPCNVKAFYLRNIYKWKIGKNTRLFNGIKLDGDTYGRVQIGDNCHICKGCVFNTNWDGFIKIGNNVAFGHDVYLYGVDHDPSDRSLLPRCGPIVIEDNCWIATRSSVLKGVTIAKNSVVAFGAVVTKDIPENVIFGGVPAKIIRKRFDEDE